jgi:hypothetical protein
MKLWCSVLPKAICLTVRVPLGTLGLGAGAELELELEHPAIVSRPTTPTAVPSQVALRRLMMFTRRLYAIRVTYGAAELDMQLNDRWREDDQILMIWSTQTVTLLSRPFRGLIQLALL